METSSVSRPQLSLHPSWRHLAPTRTAALTVALALAGGDVHAAYGSRTLVLAAWAVGAPDCSGPGGALSCHLTGVLHILYVAAAILGVVLLAVIVLAIKIYRQNDIADGKRRR